MRYFWLICVLVTLSTTLFAAGPYFVNSNPTGCGGVACADTNNGTSTATAFAHGPGMPGCSNNCAAITGSNTTIYLKGGESYTVATGSLPWSLVSGTSVSAVMTYSYKADWFTSQTVSGKVSCSGTICGLVSGYPIIPDWNGTSITINGTSYTIASIGTGNYMMAGADPVDGSALMFPDGFWFTVSGGTPGTLVNVAYSHTGLSYPKLDGAGATISANNQFVKLGKFVTLVGMEMAGLYWNYTGTHTFGNDVYVWLNSAGTNQVYRYLYLHDWDHASYASGTRNTTCGIVGSIQGPGYSAGTSGDHIFIDGSDAKSAGVNTPDSCTANFGGGPTNYSSIYQYTTNGVITSGANPGSFHDNSVRYLVVDFVNTGAGGCPNHANGFEDNGSFGDDVYNNYFLHLNINCALDIWNAVYYGSTSRTYNNIVVDGAVSTPLGVFAATLPPSGNPYTLNSGGYSPSGTVVVVNNTIDMSNTGTSAVSECGDGSSNAVYPYTVAGSTIKVSGAGQSGSSLLITNTGASAVKFPPNGSTAFVIAGDSTVYYMTDVSDISVTAGGTQTIAITPALAVSPANLAVLTIRYANQRTTNQNNVLIGTSSAVAGTNTCNSTYKTTLGKATVANLINHTSTDWTNSGNGYTRVNGFAPSTGGFTVTAGSNTTSVTSADILSVNRPAANVNPGARQFVGAASPTVLTLHCAGTGNSTASGLTSGDTNINITCAAGVATCVSGSASGTDGCSANYANNASITTISATAAAGSSLSTLVGSVAGCSGSTCSINTGTNATVDITATFTLVPTCATLVSDLAAINYPSQVTLTPTLTNLTAPWSWSISDPNGTPLIYCSNNNASCHATGDAIQITPSVLGLYSLSAYSNGVVCPSPATRFLQVNYPIAVGGSLSISK